MSAIYDTDMDYVQGYYKPENEPQVYNFAQPPPERSKEEQREITVTNMKYIIFYALSLLVALGINDLVTSTFSSFPRSQHIIAKVTYIVIIFGITIYLAYLLKSKISF